MRRETADAEQRAAQLEAELQRMIRAHTEREEDLDRKMDSLNRHATAWLTVVLQCQKDVLDSQALQYVPTSWPTPSR